jgi:hypothetical protein
MPNPKSLDARKEFNMAVIFTCIGAVLAVAGVAASIAGSSDGTTITVFWGAILTGAIMIGYSLIGFVRAFQIKRGKVGENGELPIDVALKKASFLRILILAVLMTLVLFVIAYLILDPDNPKKKYGASGESQASLS